MASTLITVAPTGAEADKAAVPVLPVTLDELVGTAKECEAAGAAVIHVHIRDEAARPTLDRGRLAPTVAALRERQLRRRRLQQPLGVYQGAVPADPGAPGGPGVRAVRPRARGHAAPA